MERRHVRASHNVLKELHMSLQQCDSPRCDLALLWQAAKPDLLPDKYDVYNRYSR